MGIIGNIILTIWDLICSFFFVLCSWLITRQAFCDAEYTKLQVSNQNGIVSRLYLICLAQVNFPVLFSFSMLFYYLIFHAFFFADVQVNVSMGNLWFQAKQLVRNLVQMQNT